MIGWLAHHCSTGVAMEVAAGYLSPKDETSLVPSSLAHDSKSGLTKKQKQVAFYRSVVLADKNVQHHH
ncbi:hypothetical protein MHYP_G00239190 [Metynnis hypsauchen]